MGTSLDASRETRPYPAPEPIAAVLLFCRNTCIAPVAPPACCPKSSATAPVMFLISSRPQLPAPLSVPSAQFRKGRRPAEKPFNPMEFSKSRARFRAWTLGTGREAGSWGRDEIRNIVGSIAPWSAENNASGAFSVGDTRTSRPNGTGTPGSINTLYNFDASLVVPTGPMNVPPHIWQPIILYLGRPR